MATFPCPSCARPLEAEDTYRDWTVRCPHCAAEFVPEEVARAAFDPAPPEPVIDAERDRAEALARVYGPGMCLELSGWVGGFLTELGSFYWLVVALAQMNNPALRNPNDRPEVTLAVAVMSGLLGVPYALVLIVGGRKMRELTSRPWAMAASVTAIGSVALFCALCVCVAFPVLFGVWGVVTLGNPVVRRAFEENAAREWEG